MSCRGKINTTCGDVMYAPCIRVEYEFPSWSGLSGEDCEDLLDVVGDLYGGIEEQGVRVSELTLDCISIPSDSTATEWAQAINDKVCDNDDRITVLEGFEGLKLSDFDFACLLGTDPCGDPISITNVKDLIQVLINKACEE